MFSGPILVTGGAGFVGSALVRVLLESTASPIVVVDNLFNGKGEFLPVSDRLDFRRLDLTFPQPIREVIADTRPEWVFHLAALHFIPYCNAHPEETLQVNVVGTQNLLEALRVHEPAKYVGISTAAVYPICDGPNREEDAAAPMDIYGLSKWMNEKQVELFAGQVQTQCAMARLFNVIGPRETNPHLIPEIVLQMLAGKHEIRLGNVKPKRDYIYVLDVAHALAAIMKGNKHSFRVYNVGTGAEYSVEEIVEELARISGQPLRIAVSANRVRAADRMHLLCDRTRIEKEVGWVPEYNLQASLAALWEWSTKHLALAETKAAS